MSAPPPGHPSAPPSYNETMHQSGGMAGAYQPNYGSVNPPPPGQMYPQQGPPGYAPPPGMGDANKPVGGYYPPQGYPAQAGAVPQYPPNQNIVVQPPAQSVVVVGGCPACRVGILEDDFTCCGVLCAILFFPLGILCCLALRQRRCANCGAIFG